MERNEYSKMLSQMSKDELIVYVINKQAQNEITLKENARARKIAESQLKKIGITKNSMNSDFSENIGRKVFVEYTSKKGLVRTCTGILINEQIDLIEVQVNSRQGLYSYFVSKSLINGMKIYRDNI